MVSHISRFILSLASLEIERKRKLMKASARRMALSSSDLGRKNSLLPLTRASPSNMKVESTESAKRRKINSEAQKELLPPPGLLEGIRKSVHQQSPSDLQKIVEAASRLAAAAQLSATPLPAPLGSKDVDNS